MELEDFVWLMKALSDPNRVKALLALRGGELCVCQLIEFLGLAPSTVSKHMSILRRAKLVSARKSGRWSYYSLREGRSEVVDRLIELAEMALVDSSEISGSGTSGESIVRCSE